MPLTRGTGHCLCGAVSYAFDAAPLWQAHCHCESCRRNCSAPFTSYFGVADGTWRWTGTTPLSYKHTPAATRFFCPTCGTPMAFRSDRAPGEMHFYAASLTDPTRYEPQEHDFWAERLPWVHLADDLPRR